MGNKKLALYLSFFATVFVFSLILDPTNQSWGATYIPVLKYSPYLMSIIALFFLYNPSSFTYNKYFFCFFLFFLAMLFGSLWSLFVYGTAIADTLFGRALGCGTFVLFYLLGQCEDEINRFVSFFLKSAVLFSMLMFFLLVMFRMKFLYGDLSQMFQVGSIVPVISLCFSFQIKNKLMYIIRITSIVSLLLIAKATALLSLCVAMFFIVTLYIKRASLNIREGNDFVAFRGILFIVFIFLCLGASLVYYDILLGRMALRENIVREYTMYIRLLQFYSSPLWGDLFTSSPNITFGELYIPSHSDILDLLAFGGLFSAAFFYTPFLHLIGKNMLRQMSLDQSGSFFSVFCLILTMSMFVNSVIGVPNFGYLFWMFLGVLSSPKHST